MEQHADLVAKAVCSPLCRHTVLGQTLDGRDMDCLTVGEGPAKIWVIARQHPGESMAEYWAEGLVDRLLDATDARANKLRARATVYIVPNMCPDGSFRGHLRTNACGSNLNREWAEPTAEHSPEVLCVRNAMDEVGCDLFVDTHGDEALPYNFMAGGEGCKTWSERHAAVQKKFMDEYVDEAAAAAASLLRRCRCCAAPPLLLLLLRLHPLLPHSPSSPPRYEAISPDFQQVHGYPVDEPGTADNRVASNQISERFDCLSVTLEMPFKDTADTPHPTTGWSPQRAVKFGAAIVDAMDHVIGDLR